MGTMKNEDFQAWLHRLACAWEHGDVEAAVSLFSSVEAYYETPFCAPVNSREEIRELWLEVPQTQNDISVQTSIISFQNNVGLAHWRAQFIRIPSRQRATLDGIYKVTFEDRGNCIEFRQWWNSNDS